MKYDSELKVGLTIIAAVVVFIFGFRFFSDLPLFRGTYELHTRLDEAGGLTSGNPVHISGVRVGSVKEVALAENQSGVEVRFRIDEDVTVPEGSTARVSGFGALGAVQLAIVPGPPTGAPLEPGGLVPAQPQRDVLEDLRSRTPQLLARTDSLLVTANAAMRAANQTFEGAGALLNDSRSDLRQTLAAVRQSTQTLNRVLVAQESRLADVLENAAVTTENTAVASEGLRTFFTAGNADSLKTAVARMNSAMRRLDALTARIERGEGTLGRLATDSTLYVRLDSTATRLSFVLEDFQQNPGRYLDELTLVEIF